ncbi:D-glycero-beta-D-manno-heptose 1-phosphate adenylyltransferase [Agromyces sp. GXS1127]|uniref:D-glycero-beta-D-manno-heptose 1-phosphate adenylyltransferase n=1 Tax=Agromyces sp. GXS1127 TaxID=3424181 RepID=UPI003D31B3F8
METTAAAAERIRRLRPRVVVVGDAILDRWWRGSSRRLSREAPAPVVDLLDQVDAPGGAANTAANAAALGAACELVAVIGTDETGDALASALAEGGVDLGRVHRDPRHRTVSKTRIVADDQVLARVDDDRESPGAAGGSVGRTPDPSAREALVTGLREAAAGADVVVVSDYGFPDLPELVADALGALPSRPPLVVDAHEVARWRDLRPDVVVPNSDEADRLLGGGLGRGRERRAGVVRSAADLLERSGASNVIVTLDREGAILITADGAVATTTAHPVAERFASGAGDTFTAAVAAAVAVDVPLEEAIRLAQGAADIALSHEGTSVCAGDELAARLARSPATLLDAGPLAARIDRHRADGRRIVFTNGCFDVLHVGHTTYLRQAAELGDILVVGVNSDDSVRRLKGPDRPVNSAEDRAGLLAALEWVDYVAVFAEDTPIALIEQLRPDVYVKGGDYSPEMLPETPIVESYGGEVRLVDYVPDRSTTSLMHRIRTSGEPDGERVR